MLKDDNIEHILKEIIDLNLNHRQLSTVILEKTFWKEGLCVISKVFLYPVGEHA